MGVFTTVSTVIPAINETDSLKEAVEIILESCCHNDLEEILIVICERTTPECLCVIAGLKEMEHGIPVNVYTQKKPGLGPALYEAMRQVTGSHVVYIAADMDTDPHILATMIEKAKIHPDAILLASRWIKGGGFVGYGQINKMLNFLFNKMLQVLFVTGVKDLTYGYRFAPVDKTLSVKWASKGFSIGMETNLRMLRLGYEIIEVPAVWRARCQGDSQNSFIKRIKYLKTVFEIRFAKLDSIKAGDQKED